MRMPVFTWMILVIQFLLLFAIPVITVALFLLMFQRTFDATFFTVSAGADPLLWQHLFWIFGHPEVYILVLPSFGIVSEVLPVFSKKPLFGYPFVVFSGAAIGFVGWGVWAHHMFASGIGPISVAVFSIATMAIAIPTGVKIVNWTLTMWGGKLRFTTAMLFAIGLIVEFTIGGLSGVTHAVAPSDTQQTDTYYIVAHFHYVLFGGAVLGFFAGFYYWWPKVFGKCLSEKLGKWNFWLMIIGMNLTFGPMHIIGLQGQPRRMYVWTDERAGEGFFNLGFWNLVASIGAFILATGILMFLINIWHTHRKAPPAPLDPWDARTLEWMTTNPPSEHNFDALPEVHSLDEFFHRKYEDVGAGDQHDLRPVATAEEILAEQARPRRPPHPHAVAVVLADPRRLAVADHRLRHDLQRAAGDRRRGAARVRPLRLGAWSRRSPTTPTTTRRRRTKRARSWSSVADTTIAAVDDHHVLGEGVEHPALGSTTGLSNNKMGMWLFLGSECLLFGGLISTYMLYRGRNDGLGPDQLYDIPFTSVSSFVLLMSSLTMVLAVSAANRKDLRNAKVWLVVTALLGATFVGGQVYEFTTFYREGLGFTTSLFSSSFYTLTGFHGVHVSVGIVMLLALAQMLRKQRVTGDKSEVVELIGLYWHFVDIVWIVIFTLVYLIPA